MVCLSLIFLGIFITPMECRRRFLRRNYEPYENDTLVQFIPENEYHLNILTKLSDLDPDIDVFKYSSGLYDVSEVLVPRNKLNFLNKFTQIVHMKMNVRIWNYGRYMDDKAEFKNVKWLTTNYLFQYHSHANLRNHYYKLVNQHPNLAKIEFLGKSFQGRKIELVKISKNPKAGNPILFIDAGIHAREWVTPVTALYFIYALLNPANANDLHNVDYYILPLVNPDGYEYSRTTQRVWRKTRSKRNNVKCIGVDGNRNFGYKWGQYNAVTDPCHFSSYCGPHAFSEPETSYIRDVMKKYHGRIKLYLTLHSYGQLILYPWGWSVKEKPKNIDKVHALALKADKAMVAAGAPPFKAMASSKLYITSGSSNDYASSVGIPYSYALELTDGHQFDYPESKLSKVIPPFYAGLKTFAKQIRTEFYHRRFSGLSYDINNETFPLCD